MSGQDEDDAAEQAVSREDMTSAVREYRRLRKRQAQTGRPPGTATLLFGRPEFSGEEGILVSGKNPHAGSPGLLGLVPARRDSAAEELEESGADDLRYAPSRADAAPAIQNEPTPAPQRKPTSELDFFEEAEVRFKRLKEKKAQPDTDDDDFHDDWETHSSPAKNWERRPQDDMEDDDDYLAPPPLSSAMESETGTDSIDAPPSENPVLQETVDGTPVIRLARPARQVSYSIESDSPSAEAAELARQLQVKVACRKPEYLERLIENRGNSDRWVDQYGRKIQAVGGQSASPEGSLPAEIVIESSCGRYAHRFQWHGDGSFHSVRKGDRGELLETAALDSQSGTIAVRDHLQARTFLFTTDGVISIIDPYGDGSRQIDVPLIESGSVNEPVSLEWVWSRAGAPLSRQESYLDGHKRTFHFAEHPAAGTFLKETHIAYPGSIEINEELVFDAVQQKTVVSRVKESYPGPGRTVEAIFGRQGQLSNLRITDNQGSYIDMIAGKGDFAGNRFDSYNRPVEEAFFVGREVLTRPRGENAPVTVETIPIYKEGVSIPEPEMVCTFFDPDIGGIHHEADLHGRQKIVFFNGRIDVCDMEGNVSWEGLGGDRTCQTPALEVLVSHRDGSVLSLDRELNCRLKNSGQKSFEQLQLPAAVKEFADKHRGVDRRDLAELVWRHSSRPERLAGILKQLDLLDSSAEALGPDRVEILKAVLLHHVAYPQEIYGGRATPDFAAALEREFAAENPARYVAVIREALTGNVGLTGGIRLAFEAEKLLSDDLTGRNLASRIFQAVAGCVAYHPHLQFENSFTGIGHDAKHRRLPGLTTVQIADVLVRLGAGKPKAISEASKGKSVSNEKHDSKIVNQTYISSRGFKIVLPAGFEAVEVSESGAAVRFFNGMDPEVNFFWAEVGGETIDCFTDCRFKKLVSSSRINFKQLAGVLTGILPPAGCVREAQPLKLPSGNVALEMVIESSLLSLLILFPGPCQKASSEPGVSENRHWFPCPVTGEPILYRPEVLATVVSGSGSVKTWFGLGHDRYEYLVFTAPPQKFERWLPVVRQQMHSFHYDRRPPYPFELPDNYPTIESWLGERVPALGAG